jgi:predicted lipoprotein with Yx(FWY)xxD motif
MNLLRSSTRTRAILFVAPAALILAAAAACGSSSSPSTAPTTATSSAGSAGSSSGASSSSAALMVTTNQSLGQIVTTGSGTTVYRYDADSDNPPKSNCDGGCASAWPPVLVTGSGPPQVSGVSSSLVGEVTRSDGSKQLTLDGWPLYTYAGDSGAGSTAGQGSGGTWWAVTPAGAKAAAGGGAATTTSSGSGSGGGY